MKTNVPLFDKAGNETGTEEIEIIEVGEHQIHMTLTDKPGDIGYITTITEVEVICSDKVEKDTIVAELDNIYGYFNYKLI